MFNRQRIEIDSDSLESLTKTILMFREIGDDFTKENINNRYRLSANHLALRTILTLYKININGNTTKG